MYLLVNWDLFVFSFTCCHPGWKHQHCESVTDWISNQCWSCQRQVRSSMYCCLIVIIKKCLPWNNVESIYWNLLQSRGQTPLHNLGQYGKENAAAMFELFRETMPDYPLDIPDSEGNTGKFCHPVCLLNIKIWVQETKPKSSIKWSCWSFLIFDFVCLSSAAPSLYER